MRTLAGIAVAAAILLTTPAAADVAAGVTAYKNGNYAEALVQFQTAAEGGDARAQLGIALIYHKGLGVAPDPAEAVKWYRRAAEIGNATAQNNLGVMYRRGEGVERDPREAFSWIWMAAMQGYPRAELNLADLYRTGEGVTADPILAYVWLQFAMDGLTGDGRELATQRYGELAAAMSPEDIQRAERMTEALRATRSPQR